VLRLVLAAAVLALAPAPAAACERDPHTGRTAGPYYSTQAPFEHFSSARTAVFPHTCAVRGPVRARMAPGDYSTPYIAVTRDRRQLYVYGYRPDAATQGAYVASVDTRSLRERWRARILDPSPPRQWSYPGVLAAHGNGFLYAIYGNVIVKLDPLTGATLARRDLPEDPNGTGAAYNGLIVLPDGNVAAKKIERGPCPAAESPFTEPATVGAFAGLNCAAVNALPSRLVVLEPGRLRVMSSVVPPEPVTGRITFGGSFIYAAGRDHVFRFRYRNGRVALDRRWGPVVYRTGAQRPGTGPGLLGDFLVVQTNFLPAAEPLTVTAVSTHDSDRVFRIKPFGRSTGSWIVSKPALDAATGTIVTHDTSAGRMAALHLDPRRGLRVSWRRKLSSLDFSALIGDAHHRQIAIPDLTSRGDTVVWLSERTGREVARTKPLAPASAPGNIVTPGFDGRFYYLSGAGRLWELSTDRRNAAAESSTPG
jgi:hypothetical protein